ncbi:MAG: hypothetical protein ACK4YQ_08300 [Phenylobacterium sp.]|uniref:hypothetical protein n=1 Tax=Phenylobacterium sp. TaxID=1871053 RepID=UPI003918BC08
MAFGFSGSIGGEKSKTSSTTTSTPNVPDWIRTGVQDLSSSALGLAGTDPRSFTADWNPYQQTAADGASRLGGSNRYLDQAFSIVNLVGNYKAPRVQAQSLLDNLSSYQSPYTKNVVDAALADYDFGAGQSRAAQSAELARSSAFGGSRAGIALAQTEGALARGRASTAANLYDQAFNAAANLSGQDAARRQEASAANAQLALAKQNQGVQLAQLLAEMGFQQNASNRADIASQLAVGDALYGVQNTQAQAPISTLAAASQIYSGLPLQLFVGNTTNQTGKSSSFNWGLSGQWKPG